MVMFRDGGDSIKRKDIAAFEKRNGVRLPQKYTSFLLASNGGIPTPQMVDIPNTKHSVLVDYLYGIRIEREMGDIEYETKLVNDDLPLGFVVIGHDPGGNAFLLATEGEETGRVYFWDKGRLLLKGESGNTFWLADNIDAFLAMIH